MILGIGIDIVHLPRIAAVIERRTSQKLADRILSPSETEHWLCIENEIQQQTRFLAVRYVLVPAQTLFTHYLSDGRSKKQHTKLCIPRPRQPGKISHTTVSDIQAVNRF